MESNPVSLRIGELSDDDCPPGTIHVIGDASTRIFQHEIVGYGGYGDFQPGEIVLPDTSMLVVDPITITFSFDKLIEFQDAILNVSESFRKFIQAVRDVTSNFIDRVNALEIDWDVIEREREILERKHAHRFMMYQRRYARGKQK